MSATIRLKKSKGKSLHQRHPWIYSGAIENVDGSPEPGDVVTVTDGAGEFVARGYYNPSSKISIRVLEWRDVEIGEAWWKDRVRAALETRRMAGVDLSACRLIHAEADLMPGVIADRYNDVVVLQLSTVGAVRARDAIAAALQEVVDPVCIYERSDTASRQHEGLSAENRVLQGMLPETVQIREGDLVFEVDVAGGQKTGWYLDQRDNRAIVGGFAKGRDVLDAYCYTGGFSVHCARGGANSLMMADSSTSSLEQAQRHLEINNCECTADLLHEDVSELLRMLKADNRRFDMVILDPPKFAHTRHQVDKAMRGYKDINMLAMQLLNPGGILATFSCSGAIDVGTFTMAVSWAGVDAGRDVQVLRRLSQGPDHPILTAFPESEYLKGLLCRVV